MNKNILSKLSLLFVISILGSGCASTYTMQGIEPAKECGPCVEKSKEFNTDWGPVTLGGSGKVEGSNWGAVNAWYNEIKQEATKAETNIIEQGKNFACGPTCNKKWTLTETIKIELNAKNTEKCPECEKTIHKRMTATGEGWNCLIAYYKLMSAIVDSIEVGLDGECKKIAEECTIADITTSLASIDMDQDSKALWCTATATFDVVGHCAKSTGPRGVNSPSASGTFKMKTECEGKNACTEGDVAMCGVNNIAICYDQLGVPHQVTCSSPGNYIPCSLGAWSITDSFFNPDGGNQQSVEPPIFFSE